MLNYVLKTWDGGAAADEAVEEHGVRFLFDAEAIVCASELAESHDRVELWRDAKMIAYFAPQTQKILWLN